MATMRTLNGAIGEWIIDSFTGTTTGSGSLNLGISSDLYDITSAYTLIQDGTVSLFCIPFVSSDKDWRINVRRVTDLTAYASTSITVYFLKRGK